MQWQSPPPRRRPQAVISLDFLSQVGKEVGLTTYSTLFPEKLNVELDRTAPTSACANTEVRLCSRAVTTGPAVTYSALVSPLNGTRIAQIQGGWQ